MDINRVVTWALLAQGRIRTRVSGFRVSSRTSESYHWWQLDQTARTKEGSCILRCAVLGIRGQKLEASILQCLGHLRLYHDVGEERDFNGCASGSSRLQQWFQIQIQTSENGLLGVWILASKSWIMIRFGFGLGADRDSELTVRLLLRLKPVQVQDYGTASGGWPDHPSPPVSVPYFSGRWRICALPFCRYVRSTLSYYVT